MSRSKELDLSDISVLVVDDSKYMRLLLKETLRALNIRSLETASDGADALKTMKDFEADLIITDWRMAPVDGLELVRLIRRDPASKTPWVPIIMVSAYTELENVLEARDAGINEFIAKPVSPFILYQRMVGIIESPRLFVRAGDAYVGPDRRRTCDVERDYLGLERRKAKNPDVQVAPASDPFRCDEPLAV